MALFYPTLYRRRVTDITVEDLHRLGVRGILLDVDNTLTIHDAPDLTDAVKAWLAQMQKEGFRLAIVSNNQLQRVEPFAKKIGLSYQALARKPMPSGFRHAAEKLNLSPMQCVAVGDQMFTDILGGNLSGMPTILLEPIRLEEGLGWFIPFKRKLERLLMCSRSQRQRKERDYA